MKRKEKGIKCEKPHLHKKRKSKNSFRKKVSVGKEHKACFSYHTYLLHSSIETKEFSSSSRKSFCD
jgi:hypothetical protein